MSDIKVIVSSSLSNENGKRYVVVDKETGEILDDAQGYGYKTAQNAHKGWAYKTRDKSKDREKAERIRHIKHWMKEHKFFVHAMENYAFEIAKGSCEPGEVFDAKHVAELLKRYQLETDFTAGELLRVWQKH